VLTSRTTSQSGNDWELLEAYSGIHNTLEGALNWLTEDGDGRLGPASKEAWTNACQMLPGMQGLQLEVVE